MKRILTLSSMIYCLLAQPCFADKTSAHQKATNDAMNEVKALSSDIQNLKLEVVALNNELIHLEEDLLFPSSTKYSFFVSMNSGQFFTLESAKLKIDGKLVTTHLYDADDRAAFARGGVQKLFITNISEGKHTATVFFTGLGPNKMPFKRASEIAFTKKKGQGFVEITINDNGATQEPDFEINRW